MKSTKTGESGMADEAQVLDPFAARLQTLLGRLKTCPSLDELQRGSLPLEILAAFGAQRLILFAAARGRGTEQVLVCQLATGVSGAATIRLPVNTSSIAGYVAGEKSILSIADVADAQELNGIDPGLRFFADIDRRTGFKTRQVLCAPILTPDRRQLLGVIELLNQEDDATGKFPAAIEHGVQELCGALARIVALRARTASEIANKYRLLIVDGVLTQAEFSAAMTVATQTGVDVEEVLIRDYRVGESVMGEALAAHFKVPYEPYRRDRPQIGPEIQGKLKKEYVLHSNWMPLGLEADGGGLQIMCLDPDRSEVLSVIRQVFPQSRLSYCVTTRREFVSTAEQLFTWSGARSTDDHLSADQRATVDAKADLLSVSDDSVVGLINKIILAAHRMGASDIHFEPDADRAMGVRVRRDGIMHWLQQIQGQYRAAVPSRLKIMAGLDISEKRLPQDGKIRFQHGDVNIELRMSTMPTAGDVEDVVLRLSVGSKLLDLQQLGIAPDTLERIMCTVAKPYGLFLVCGPTGSGKTTTLHSILAPLNTSAVKIWTAEHPVEITQPGLRQVQVNIKAGLTFAAIMRSLLRDDPDIIMVGECRDPETAAMTIEASLTGHLVMSTMHTNSAPEAVVRLLDLGMDPFNFSYALLGVLGQRLVRRLCTTCKQAHVLDEHALAQLVAEYCAPHSLTESYVRNPQETHARIRAQWQQQYGDNGKIRAYRPIGCRDCLTTGYRGRVGLHELMVGSDQIKELIQGRAPVRALYTAALKEGMRTIKQDGILKVLDGITDMLEVRRVAIE